MLPTKHQIEDTANTIYQYMRPTPQYCWPSINQRTGGRVWVKHENHTPIGAFKARGNIAMIDWLKKTGVKINGVISATRGNHGQGVARAASIAGFKAKIVVPFGNSREKSLAMRNFGAEVVEHGADFSESVEFAKQIAKDEDLYMIPAFHEEIVKGVATYGLELLLEAGEIDTVYVAVGCGSGICGLIAAREALNYKTKIVGVVSEGACAAKVSFESGKIVAADRVHTFADGIAVRVPNPEAFELYSRGADRFVAVSDDEIADAIRYYFTDTHNIAEGAGAAALAGLIKDRHRIQNKEVAVILSGGNIDRELFQEILENRTPLIAAA